MEKRELGPDNVRELLDYNPETGELTWRERGREWFKNKQAWSVWNNRFAGKPALACVHVNGYLNGSLLGKKYLTHRVCWLHYYLEWPEDQIDHINGDRTFNAIRNLRDVTNQENARNSKVHCKNKTGVAGVSWDKHNGKWVPTICAAGRNINLGSYDNLHEAAIARKAAEKALGFHKNHGKTEEERRAS